MNQNQIAAIQTIAETRRKATINGRTDNQKKVWKYFTDLGRNIDIINDHTYDSMVKQKIQAIDYKQRALEFCGIDEAQVQEVTPINIKSYEFEGNDVLYKIGDDGECRTSAYSIAWIFGGLKQLYVYKYTFNMHTFEKQETCDEYFYKDITNLVTSAEVKERIVRNGENRGRLIAGIILLLLGIGQAVNPEFYHHDLQFFAVLGYILFFIGIILIIVYLIKNKPSVTCAVYDKFQIFVKGGVSFTASMKATDDTERSINGLKNKWREKKNM